MRADELQPGDGIKNVTGNTKRIVCEVLADYVIVRNSTGKIATSLTREAIEKWWVRADV